MPFSRRNLRKSSEARAPASKARIASSKAVISASWTGVRACRGGASLVGMRQLYQTHSVQFVQAGVLAGEASPDVTDVGAEAFLALGQIARDGVQFPSPETGFFSQTVDRPCGFKSQYASAKARDPKPLGPD